MTKYSKPVWQMVKEAAEKMGEITARDVKQYVREKYPNDNVNELTVNAHVIACSVNHPSSHHYSCSKKFLFYLGNGRYRLYDPAKDGIWEKTQSGFKKTSSGFELGGNYFSQIKGGGQISIPKVIQEKLEVGEDDFVAFVEDDMGNIVLKKAELRIVAK